MSHRICSKHFETSSEAKEFSSMISRLAGYQWINTSPIGATKHYKVQYLQYDHNKFEYTIELCPKEIDLDICKAIQDSGAFIVRRVIDSVDDSMAEISYLAPK